MSDIDKILSTFRLLVPEFSTMEDNIVKQYIELSMPEVSEDVFCDDYSKAVAYLTADIIAISNRESSGNVGSITSKRSGDLSKSFSGTNDPTLATTYAQNFQRLVKKYSFGACVI